MRTIVNRASEYQFAELRTFSRIPSNEKFRAPKEFVILYIFIYRKKNFCSLHVFFSIYEIDIYVLIFATTANLVLTIFLKKKKTNKKESPE